MHRLQQKCFLASTGVHLLLMVVLLIGPAFLASKSKSDNSPILDVIPGKLIDAAFSNGNPNARPPPPSPLAPPAPQIAQPPPAPQPPKVQTPEPAPEPEREVKPTKPDPEALETNNDHKRKKPEADLTPVVRKANPKKAAKTPNTTTSTDSTDSTEQRQADARKRAASLIGATARNLLNEVSPGVSFETPGNGAGGEAYASYDSAVRSIYWHAWAPPEDTASDAAITKATVTIASDGTVLSARILKPSGDKSVDNSVQRTLDRVTFIAPFPEGAKDKQRTYTINFNLKAKRLSG